MTISQAEFNRLKEAIEVLAGISGKGAKDRRAVRWNELQRALDRAVIAVKTVGSVHWDNIVGKPSTFPPDEPPDLTELTAAVEALTEELEQLIADFEAMHPWVLEDGTWNVNGTWRTDRTWDAGG